MRIVVGGVGQLYQGDLDAGRLVVERLGAVDGHVTVEDFHYGAVAVSQRLEELSPDVLILVGAEERGRRSGAVTRVVPELGPIDPVLAQDSVEGAVTGYVTIDLVLDVLRALGTAPARVVVFEIEPERVGPHSALTEIGERAVTAAIRAVRSEVGRTPLYAVAERIRDEMVDGHVEKSPAVRTVGELLAELAETETNGAWGRTFALRDLLRAQIAGGDTGEGITQLDWSLWWALIEELDRLQKEEGA